MRLFAVVAALGLSACAASPSIQSALTPLTGQPVQIVFDQLGPPTSSTPDGADVVHVWHSTTTVRAVPRGYNGAPSPPSPDAPTSGTFPGPMVLLTCDVVIVANAEGMIRGSQFGEESGSCRESARKLSQLALVD